jgi:hypothetical protein
MKRNTFTKYERVIAKPSYASSSCPSDVEPGASIESTSEKAAIASLCFLLYSRCPVKCDHKDCESLTGGELHELQEQETSLSSKLRLILICNLPYSPKMDELLGSAFSKFFLHSPKIKFQIWKINR